LDEPTAGLDPQSRNMMWETIKTLAKGGTTIFLTTQYLEEADQLADRIAILNQGRIVAEGTSQDLKKLLPLGKIELRFHSQKQLDAAAVLLDSYGPMQDDDVRSLTIKTDGTLAQVVRLFSQIQAANIETAEFSQKLPTLDDAFLKIINNNEGKK
jgi:ABC-2 type transport system ATP-binding protein